MTVAMEFFSAAEYQEKKDESYECSLGLEALLLQSTYAPTSESVRNFISDVVRQDSDAVEKKFFYGIRRARGEALVGFAQFRLIEDSADLDFVIVSEDFRGLGFARTLLSRAIGEIQFAGAQRLLLEVAEGNLSAQSLYLQLGFETISIRKKYYKNGENAFIMELTF